MLFVLDTDVLVAGLRSKTGASRQLLRLLEAGQLDAVVNISMILEYEAVLKRPSNLHHFGLTSGEIDEFLDGFVAIVAEAATYYTWRPTSTDPDDEHVIEAAINGFADAIVTFSIRHIRLGAERFGIDVLKPGEALRRVRNDTPPE